jgi:hypothetical protein
MSQSPLVRFTTNLKLPSNVIGERYLLFSKTPIERKASSDGSGGTGRGNTIASLDG